METSITGPQFGGLSEAKSGQEMRIEQAQSGAVKRVGLYELQHLCMGCDWYSWKVGEHGQDGRTIS